MKTEANLDMQLTRHLKSNLTSNFDLEHDHQNTQETGIIVLKMRSMD
jgi:hypothetical protein